jgi:putative FmdB family regulatory protein
MPIYEYRCKKCGKEFEIFQKMSDPVIKTCKICKGPANRLISMSSFHLKGGGWYVTDYGGKKAPASEKKKDDAATSASTEAGSITESSSTSGTDKKD